MMTGAELLVQALLQEGVDHIFGYGGATICPIIDVLRRTPEIGYTLVRNEQNAGHMASGYARVTGKAGVCLVTSGPGATNLITGIATAHLDSIPMVAITGQVPSHLLGRDIFQEVDITGAVSAFSKHTYLVKDAAQLPRIVKEAFYIATTGRPGVVLIDIPQDIQSHQVEELFPERADIRGYHPETKCSSAQISHLIKTISAAKQPVICAGGGVFLADAAEEMAEFARRMKIPVVTTMMGLSLLPTDDPLYMGMIGSFGGACANKALAKSDLLIMLGTRVADRAILSPNEIHRRMPSIHIDVDPAEIGKNIRSELSVEGDVKTVLNQLLKRRLPQLRTDWLPWLQTMRKEELSKKKPFRTNTVSPGRLMDALGRAVDSDATICVDVGQNQIWACKHLWFHGQRMLTSGGLGTMGYSLPAAVGVKVAQPDKQCVVICGDGSFQMEMNELSAVKASGMDIKIVLLRNGVLGLVNQIQNKAPYHGSFGVDLEGSPDFETIAAAYGIPAMRVENDCGLEENVARFLSQEGPGLLIADVASELTLND